MPALRTLFSSLLIIAIGVVVLVWATDGFRAFTTETARRIDVRNSPRNVPDVALQTADGQLTSFDALRGRWLLVNFIYTRCATYCSVQGGEFAQLQDRLAVPIAREQLTLLSISFDPAHDDPASLAAYKQRFGARGAGWISARPTTTVDLAALRRVFGVTVIADELGGFVHNAAIAVVNPDGRLVAILDWDAPNMAARYVMARLGS